MKKSLHLALVLIASLALPGIEAASATEIHQFKGTRDQVRKACTGPGRELIEGGDTTFCSDDNKHTGVICNDAGQCTGSTPSRAQGGRRLTHPGPEAVFSSLH